MLSLFFSSSPSPRGTDVIRAQLLGLAQVINGKILSSNFIAQSPFGYLFHSKYEGLFAVSPLDIKTLNINSSIYSASEALYSAHGPFGKVCKSMTSCLSKVLPKGQ